MNKLLVLILGIMGIFVLTTNSVSAQTKMNADSKDKSRWYTAPREFQIIDDRPVVKDFREAPSQEKQITLPLGPGAANDPGVRVEGSGGLAHSGFGGNINPKTMAPASNLPGVNRTNMGSLMKAPAKGQNAPIRVAAPVVVAKPGPASYGGNYSVGQSSGGGMNSSTAVKGTLLGHH